LPKLGEVVERERERERGIGLNDFQWFFWIWYPSGLHMKTPKLKRGHIGTRKKEKKHR
jgi:hypothetical protein